MRKPTLWTRDALIVDNLELKDKLKAAESKLEAYRKIDKLRFKALTEVEAKLEAVGKLPDRWTFNHLNSGIPVSVWSECADELQAIMEDK